MWEGAGNYQERLAVGAGLEELEADGWTAFRGGLRVLCDHEPSLQFLATASPEKGSTCIFYLRTAVSFCV